MYFPCEKSKKLDEQDKVISIKRLLAHFVCILCIFNVKKYDNQKRTKGHLHFFRSRWLLDFFGDQQEIFLLKKWSARLRTTGLEWFSRICPVSELQCTLCEHSLYFHSKYELVKVISFPTVRYFCSCVFIGCLFLFESQIKTNFCVRQSDYILHLLKVQLWNSMWHLSE